MIYLSKLFLWMCLVAHVAVIVLVLIWGVTWLLGGSGSQYAIPIVAILVFSLAADALHQGVSRLIKPPQ